MGTEPAHQLEYGHHASAPDPRGRWSAVLGTGVACLAALWLASVVPDRFPFRGPILIAAVFVVPPLWLGSLISAGRGLFSKSNVRRAKLGLALTAAGSCVWIAAAYWFARMVQGAR